MDHFLARGWDEVCGEVLTAARCEASEGAVAGRMADGKHRNIYFIVC